MSQNPRWERLYKGVRKHLGAFLDNDLHAKRITSLANATFGVMVGTSLAVAMIGQSLAQARGLVTKHAIKQIDRLLSNQGIVVWKIFALWVPYIIGERTEIVVAMDWTDYDKDGQSTLMLSTVTQHGRATPLLWLTVHKEELKERRNDFEDACLVRLAGVVPPGTQVTILADRGFGDTKLFKFLESLGFHYVIRFRGDIHVKASTGETRKAAEWVGPRGRGRRLIEARVTSKQVLVPVVVCVQAKGMKEPWCIATDLEEATSRQIVNYYAKRWTIEPSFRDTKDIRFGMGLSKVRIADAERRDRLLLVSAFAVVLLTLLGTAGESLGMDRQLKSNTTSRRTHSLFRQGCMLYDLIPTMPDERLTPLICRFEEMIRDCRLFSDTFAPV